MEYNPTYYTKKCDSCKKLYYYTFKKGLEVACCKGYNSVLTDEPFNNISYCPRYHKKNNKENNDEENKRTN